MELFDFLIIKWEFAPIIIQCSRSADAVVYHVNLFCRFWSNQIDEIVFWVFLSNLKLIIPIVNASFIEWERKKDREKERHIEK